MASFEAARERYKPAESQSQLSQRTLIASLPSQTPSKSQRTTRRSQPTSSATLHAITENEQTLNARDLASEQTDQVYSRELPLSFEHHFSTNINLGWQKLDHYYTLTDSTPIYRAAVFLHPCMKW